MEIKRRKFQGVLNILSFNRQFYFFGLLVLGLIMLFQYVFNWEFELVLLIIVGFLYGLLAPLLVSAYVYDFSKFYEFNWLNDLQLNKNNNLNIVNINAGFDETSFILKNKFQQSNLKVFDFYDESKHTEQAIKRARKVSLVYPNTQRINTNAIPINENTVDILFLLSSVHEIRKNKEKIVFFNECRRVLKHNGKIVIVEHLRDLPNFLAFSIGFTHFFSKQTWKKVFKKTNLKLKEEIKFTPFMSVFILNK
ncbi:class I SAM-dependent methyltransferase [Tenacibaculum geojense]|uniref:Class I SAM-dependent methyltransferase n=1 Tax=Tenacibaculum geojense TaxID=915352 RepID=A0ABW3JS11_9FLAO